MIFGNIKNKIFLTITAFFIFGFLFLPHDAFAGVVTSFEIPNENIKATSVIVKVKINTVGSGQTTLELKDSSNNLVQEKILSYTGGNITTSKEFTGLTPLKGYSVWEKGTTTNKAFLTKNYKPLSVATSEKTPSSVKAIVSSIPDDETVVTITLFEVFAGTGTELKNSGELTKDAGQVVYNFTGITFKDGYTYRVEALTKNQTAFGQITVGSANPVTLPTGGTSATIGGWCVENTATGTTSLCTSTARWGSKEECETVNKPSKCTEVYELLAPLPFIGSEIETGGGPEGLAKYLTILFRLAIGIIGVLSVLMIVFAGMEYMTEETPFGKGEGKKRLTGAVIGLLLALASVIILQTIDPTLLNLGFDLPQAKLAVDGAVAPLKDGLPDWRACVSKKEPVGYNNGNGNCADCVTLPADITVTSGGKTVVPTLKDSLASMLSKTSGEWKITEAFPPDLKRHCHPCHYNGTCVDLALTSANNAVNIKALIEAAKSSGIGKIVFETSSKQKEQELISGGVLKENILVLPSTHITGEHFSVYK